MSCGADCVLLFCFSVFFSFFFFRSLSSSLSGCVTAPPLCSFPSPCVLRPQLLFNNVLDAFLSFVAWLMAHPDSRFWVRDSVHMVYFSWQVLLPPSFQQYTGKNGSFLSKMGFAVSIDVRPTQLTLLRFSGARAHGLDSKGHSEAWTQYSVKAFKQIKVSVSYILSTSCREAKANASVS